MKGRGRTGLPLQLLPLLLGRRRPLRDLLWLLPGVAGVAGLTRVLQQPQRLRPGCRTPTPTSSIKAITWRHWGVTKQCERLWEMHVTISNSIQ